MADMYGRLPGKPGVAIAQSIWMATNGGSGIVESYLGGIPMLIVCDLSYYAYLPQFGPYQNGSGDYGAVDLPNMM